MITNIKQFKKLLESINNTNDVSKFLKEFKKMYYTNKLELLDFDITTGVMTLEFGMDTAEIRSTLDDNPLFFTFVFNISLDTPGDSEPESNYSSRNIYELDLVDIKITDNENTYTDVDNILEDRELFNQFEEDFSDRIDEYYS
jgi:hypothetical protein